MLAQADLQNALAQALEEFAPAWKIVTECSPVDPLDPSHWAVGSHSVHVNIRHRVTGRLKVLGRRVAEEPSAGLHRAVALSLVESYVHGNGDPIRRYLEDIGVAIGSEREAGHILRPPAAVAAVPASLTHNAVEELPAPPAGGIRGRAALTRTPVVEAPYPLAVVEPPRAIPMMEPPRAMPLGEPARPVVAPPPPLPSAESPRSLPLAPPQRLPAGDPPRPVKVAESSRPALPVPPHPSVIRASGLGGNRVFRRIKREFQIWQWRRAAISIAQKSASATKS